MSQDLLTEFDSFYQPPSKPPIPSPPPPQSISPPKQFSTVHHNASQFGRGHRHRARATTFDDLLGIMDTGLISHPKPQPVNALQYQERRRPVSLHGARSFGYNSSRLSDDPYSSGLFDIAPQRGTSTSELYANNSQVFDNFGNFEAARTSPPTPAASKFTGGHSHTQSLFDSFSPTSIFTAQPPPTRQFSITRPGLFIDSTTSVASEDYDDFGDFVTSIKTPELQTFQFPPPSTSPNLSLSESFVPAPPRTSESQFSPPPGRMSSQHLALKQFASSPKKLPPPPPEAFPSVAILLRSLAPLFLLPQSHLLDRLKGLPFPVRQRILAHGKTKEFLEGVCELGRVAGRIIAGRKRRTRTLNLPPNGGGRGGMRLGTVSNFEAQKEDREVKEVCRIWREGVGRLKAAMGEVIPELQEEWKGSLKGNNTCKLCKLDKGELVPSLRERTQRPGWWDNSWRGHGSCRGFWERHSPEVKAAS